jgi:hypothetical protein
VRHVDQIPPVAAVKTITKLYFQFLHTGIRFYDIFHICGMDLHLLSPVFDIQDTVQLKRIPLILCLYEYPTLLLPLPFPGFFYRPVKHLHELLLRNRL